MTTALSNREPTGIALRDAVNQLFEDSFVRPWSGFGRPNGSQNGSQYLPLDIYESDEAFVVKAFVPGVSQDHLDITVQQQTLTIRAEQPVEKQEGVRYHLRERTGGTWLRSVELPAPIDAGHIEARLQNGVLLLTLPKAPEAKPHKIQIAGS